MSEIVEPTYRVKEVASKLGVTPAIITQMCRTGQFVGAYKTRRNGGGTWRIPVSSFVDYVNVVTGKSS